MRNIQAILVDAPQLSDYLDEDSKAHFAGLCELPWTLLVSNTK